MNPANEELWALVISCTERLTEIMRHCEDSADYEKCEDYGGSLILAIVFYGAFIRSVEPVHREDSRTSCEYYCNQIISAHEKFFEKIRG
jgi:hypothetical protein